MRMFTWIDMGTTRSTCKWYAIVGVELLASAVVGLGVATTLPFWGTAMFGIFLKMALHTVKDSCWVMGDTHAKTGYSPPTGKQSTYSRSALTGRLDFHYPVFHVKSLYLINALHVKYITELRTAAFISVVYCTYWDYFIPVLVNIIKSTCRYKWNHSIMH